MKPCNHVPKSFIYRTRSLKTWTDFTIVSGTRCGICGKTLEENYLRVYNPWPRYTPTVLRR